MKVQLEKTGQARSAITSVIRVFLLILVLAFGGVTSIEAHPQDSGINSSETAISLTSHDACCHDGMGEVAMTTCASSTCCPAVSGTELTLLAVLVPQNRAILAHYSAIRRGLSTLPLINPPIAI